MAKSTSRRSLIQEILISTEPSSATEASYSELSFIVMMEFWNDLALITGCPPHKPRD